MNLYLMEDFDRFWKNLQCSSKNRIDSEYSKLWFVKKQIYAQVFVTYTVCDIPYELHVDLESKE